MKLQIFLDEAMTADLLALAQSERRLPRQQAEWLLERALRAAMREPEVLRSSDAHQEGQTAEGPYEPAFVE